MKYSPLMPMLNNEEVVFVDFQGGKVYRAVSEVSPFIIDGEERIRIKWIADNELTTPIFTEVRDYQEAIQPEVPMEIIEKTIHTQQQLQGRRPPIIPGVDVSCRRTQKEGE